MNTAGRTVAYSAVTVAFALITLTVFPLGFLQSMGIAGAVVALVAGLASLVIAPTMFAIWGAKLAVRRRRPERPAEQGAWYRLAHAVMRRPLRVAVVTGLLMLAARAAVAAGGLDPGRLVRDPEGPERAHRRRHARARLRRPGHEPDHDRARRPRGRAGRRRGVRGGARGAAGRARR